MLNTETPEILAVVGNELGPVPGITLPFAHPDAESFAGRFAAAVIDLGLGKPRCKIPVGKFKNCQPLSVGLAASHKLFPFEKLHIGVYRGRPV